MRTPQHVELLHNAANTLYSALAPLLRNEKGLDDAAVGPTDDGRAVLVLLEGGPVVWVGSGFYPASAVALHTPGDWRCADCRLSIVDCMSVIQRMPTSHFLRPFLHTVPPSFACHAAVLEALGVPATFGSNHLKNALHEAAAMARGPLAPEHLDVVVDMVRCC